VSLGWALSDNLRVGESQGKPPEILKTASTVAVLYVGLVACFQGISSDLVLVDVVVDKLRGEVMDLQHGSTFLKSAVIQASGPGQFIALRSSQGHTLCIMY